MLDVTRIEEFEWDSGNERKGEKHGVMQQEAEQVFLRQPLLLRKNTKHSGSEPRFHALGKSFDGRLLHIAFTVPGAGVRIRVILVRPMHWKERVAYEKTS